MSGSSGRSHDDERRVDLVEEAGELVDRAAGVHREHHGAQPGDPEPGEHLGGKVPADDEHDVALTDPVAHEAGGSVGDELLGLGERELLVTADEPRSGPVPRCAASASSSGMVRITSVIYHVNS